jgi:Protein of unknown function (DUF541)
MARPLSVLWVLMPLMARYGPARRRKYECRTRSACRSPPTQKEAKYDALRGDAVRDALRKANSYVNGLGLKLGGVLEIATQAPYPVPAGMPPKMLGAGKREAAAVPVEPGSEVLRTEVQVTWEQRIAPGHPRGKPGSTSRRLKHLTGYAALGKCFNVNRRVLAVCEHREGGEVGRGEALAASRKARAEKVAFLPSIRPQASRRK